MDLKNFGDFGDFGDFFIAKYKYGLNNYLSNIFLSLNIVLLITSNKCGDFFIANHCQIIAKIAISILDVLKNIKNISNNLFRIFLFLRALWSKIQLE